MADIFCGLIVDALFHCDACLNIDRNAFGHGDVHQSVFIGALLLSDMTSDMSAAFPDIIVLGAIDPVGLGYYFWRTRTAYDQ